MPLLRELVFLLIGGLGVWLGPTLGLGGRPDFLAGLVATMPFQAAHALVLMATRRLPWAVSAVLGLGSAWWAYGLADRVRFPWLAVIPVALAVLAAATGVRDALPRAASALLLWCLPLALTTVLIGATVPTDNAAAAQQLLMTAGSFYLTIRVVAGILAPLPADRFVVDRRRP